jgi:phosphoribosylaminoimidazole-succinocarboxamide synthase
MKKNRMKKKNKQKNISMAKAITRTDFNFQTQKSVYRGKVRDIYNIDDNYLLMVATDRISAFDVVLPEGIPYKGQVLNQIAAMFLDMVSDIVPTWNVASPDANVTVGYRCEPYRVEMIVRGYLTGSSWRTYKSGMRQICGIPLPEGMKEHQRFERPIITPTTKAEHGMHDQDISGDTRVSTGLVPEDEYRKLEDYSMKLFLRGSEIAAARGLILVDTKYEFGRRNGEIYLIDEIHTPDSSRYFYADGYDERFKRGEQQKQLSKEFVREWLMANGFQGGRGEKVPVMTPAFIKEVSDRYIELYENITGTGFVKADTEDPLRRIEKNVLRFLAELK